MLKYDNNIFLEIDVLLLLRLYTRIHKKGTSVWCSQNLRSYIPMAQVPKLPVLLFCDEMAVFSQSFFFPSLKSLVVPLRWKTFARWLCLVSAAVPGATFFCCCSLHHVAAANLTSRIELSIWVLHRKKKNHSFLPHSYLELFIVRKRVWATRREKHLTGRGLLCKFSFQVPRWHFVNKGKISWKKDI